MEEDESPFGWLPDSLVERILINLGPLRAVPLGALSRRFRDVLKTTHWDSLKLELEDTARADRLQRVRASRDYRFHRRGEEKRDRRSTRAEASLCVAGALRRAHLLARLLAAGRLGAFSRLQLVLRFADPATPVDSELERRTAEALLELLAAAAAAAPLEAVEIDAALRYTGEEEDDDDDEGGYDCWRNAQPHPLSRARPEPSRLAAFLSPFASLRSLELSEFACMRSEAVAAVCTALPGLRQLSVSPASREEALFACSVRDGALAAVAGGIEHVALVCEHEVHLGDGVAALAAGPAAARIRSLRLPSGLLTERALEAAGRLSALESLQLSVDTSEPLGCAAAERLASLPSLRSLSLDVCAGPGGSAGRPFLSGLAAGLARSPSASSLSLAVRGPVCSEAGLAELLAARPSALRSLSLAALRLDGAGLPPPLQALAAGGYAALGSLSLKISALPERNQGAAFASLASLLRSLPALAELEVSFDLYPAKDGSPPAPLDGAAAAALACAAPRALRSWTYDGPHTVGEPSPEECAALAACPRLRTARLRHAAERHGQVRCYAALAPAPGAAFVALDLLLPPDLEPFARGLLAAALPAAAATLVSPARLEAPPGALFAARGA